MSTLPIITDFTQAGAPRMSGLLFLLASFSLRRGPRQPFARIPAGTLVKLNPTLLEHRTSNIEHRTTKVDKFAERLERRTLSREMYQHAERSSATL